MLDRLRKRFGDLIAGKSSVIEAEPPDASADAVEAAQETEATDVAALMLARRESQKRESRLILSERIANRAAVLLNELRTDLLQEVHRDLEEENQDQTLKTLLEVTLDSGFNVRLDGVIDGMTTTLLQELHSEFEQDSDAEPLFPEPDGFVRELRTYRDSVLKKHLLQQIEVLALPTSAQAFPLEKASAEELKGRIAQYWRSCREALDRFFRSVEMVLLDGAREGIRLDSSLIRARLVAAQYRNGYRLLEDRFRLLYGEIARLQMSTEPEEERRTALDRQVVDEIIVPLAYFIRERTEPEPREALASRAELFREIVDKVVAAPEPLNHTAEAVKPVLRKSVEQARPLILEEHSYLRTVIESLNPAAIHRTTALLKVFETLVSSDLDECSLDTIEQVIRLNRAQYRLLQQLESNYAELLPRLAPLDRIDDNDATLLANTIEQSAPPIELIEDLFLAFGYRPWPEPLPKNARHLLRLLAVVALSPAELSGQLSFYQDVPPSPESRASLAQILIDRLGPGSVGQDERQARLGAVPLPVDVGKTLQSMGYLPDDPNRLASFKDEVRNAVVSGDASQLAKVVRSLRQLRETMHQERISLGATGADGDPYFVEIWLSETGAMVGVVLCRMEGFGTTPVELVRRDPNGGDRKETEEKLRRQLQNQALIYQTFARLFRHDELLAKDQRRSLPSFVKKLYEPTEPTRHLLLSRLRYANDLLARMESFAKLIVDRAPAAAADARAALQILGGLSRKVSELVQSTEKNRDAAELARLVREYDRALKYLNTVVVHAINPWLERQTAEIATEFEFRKEDVETATKEYTSQHGIDWDRDVEGLDAHPIRGTLGCRALIRLVDGSSKVVLLNYQRQRQAWEVRYAGPRVTDIVRDALRQHGRTMPDDYDEKHEQPTFSLDEQSCRFFLHKREVARIEATLVLDPRRENLWNVVFLKYNDDILTDRAM